MKVFVCKDGFEEIMSCIFDAWTFAVNEKIGHESVRIVREKNLQQTLFDEYIFHDCEAEKAIRIADSVRNKISELAYIWIYRASISSVPDAPDAIYRFLIKAFKEGRNVTHMMAEPAVIRLYEINRAVGSEIHSFIEFLRFNSIDGKVYVAHIEPKSDVSELVAAHFDDRMPSEHFIIVDDIRHKAVIHYADEDHYVKFLTEDEFMKLSASENYNDDYTSMWNTFFNAIAIKQRANKICQQNHFPKWLRKHAVEFK